MLVRVPDGLPVKINVFPFLDELIGDDADLLIIERAGHFLPIPGNEWDGVVLIQQIDNGGHLGRFDMELGSDLFSVGHGKILSRSLQI